MDIDTIAALHLLSVWFISIPEFVTETIDQFRGMLANVKKAKKLLRQFASLSLTVEDFF